MGREEEIENIAKIMLPDSIEKMRKKICLLSGIGGVGKTQLAVEFARQNSEKFSAVFWIAGSTKVKLRLSIVSLAGQLPQHQLSERARSILKSDKEDFDAIVRDVLEWFKKPSNNQWLLIFDNVDREFSGDPEGFDIREYIPSADHGSILITSRLKDMQIARLKIVQLEPFDNQQGGLLLESIVGADLEGKLNGKAEIFRDHLISGQAHQDLLICFKVSLWQSTKLVGISETRGMYLGTSNYMRTSGKN